MNLPKISEFSTFLNETTFDFNPKGIIELENLKRVANKNNFSTEMKKSINKMIATLKSNKQIEINNSEEQILKEGMILKAKLLHGTKGFFIQSLKHDLSINKSLNILNNNKRYNQLLVKK